MFQRLTFEFQINLAAENVEYHPQISGDLSGWLSGDTALRYLGETNHGNGTATRTYQSLSGAPGEEFARLLVRRAVPQATLAPTVARRCGIPGGHPRGGQIAIAKV
ncbi:MAG: hypothetical protein R3F11_16555 [Verrucomicrobiales bacterium]